MICKFCGKPKEQHFELEWCIHNNINYEEMASNATKMSTMWKQHNLLE